MTGHATRKKRLRGEQSAAWHLVSLASRVDNIVAVEVEQERQVPVVVEDATSVSFALRYDFAAVSVTARRILLARVSGPLPENWA